MDDFDAIAAFMATILIIAFISVSRRIDFNEATKGKAGWRVNLAFWSMIAAALSGLLFGMDHPLWGDVLVSIGGGFAALAVAFLVDFLLRFLRRG
ncbi:hypothetical protein PhaeoP71_01892 [Phaeobacter piscinae]|nr:hypothetical protein PhaeoP71_01892 [Phaeobacter piscinae]